MVELVIHTGKHQGKRLSIPAAEVFIGRDEDCQIRLASTDVSRRHCLLRVSDSGGVTVRDLESRNGTFVNDMPISGDVTLKPGDLLRVGPMILQVPLPRSAAAPAPVAEAARPAAAAEPVAPRVPVAKAAAPAPTSTVPRKAATPAASNRRNKLTDDDIANWLTDDDSGVQNSGDTTIVSGRSEKKAEETPAPVPKVEKKAFSSVAEEAADIIRRHWEAVRANKK